jgi:hypothetical protein
MIDSFAAPSPTGPTIILNKSMPVLMCPACDGPDHGNTEPPPQHTG